MKRWVFAIALMLALLPLDAPISPLGAAERIAAIVNKQAILSSDVEDRTMEAAARMRLDPSDTLAMAKLRAEVLNQMVEKEVLLAEATRQAITVSPADVAQALSISPLTVQSHAKNVLAKLGVHTKVEAVRMAWRHGFGSVSRTA